MLQIQHYMAVTGFKAAYIAVLIGGNTFKWQLVKRDEELISMLVELEAEFWNCVKSGTPPKIDGMEATSKYLAEKFSSSKKSQIELPNEAEKLIRDYNIACEQLSEISEQKQLAENLLKQMLGENEVGVIGGNIVTWKVISQERLDSKLLKAEQPEIFKKYVKATNFRRFSIKSNEETGGQNG